MIPYLTTLVIPLAIVALKSRRETKELEDIGEQLSSTVAMFPIHERRGEAVYQQDQH